jgi:hypothetical protein
VQQEVHEAVMHDRQAGVAAGHHLARLDPQQVSEHLPDLSDAGEPAVVADVDPVGVPGGRRQGEQSISEVELLGGRLAARQVQLEAAAP